MGDLPLRTPTHRSLGGPLPRQLANAPHAHPSPLMLSCLNHAVKTLYGVLDSVSADYPPVTGRLHTCYSPVRRSPAVKASFNPDAPRLACVRPVASVHPEPGSNSPLFYINFSVFSFFYNRLVTLDLFEYLSPRTRIVITRTAIPSVLFPLCFLLSFVLVYRNYFNVLFYFRFARPLPCFFPKASAKLQPFSELTNYLQLFLLHFF